MFRRRSDTESGAALVEMALVAPFLLALLFGLIEFGWAFAQDLSVRHAAREGARLAAVDFGTSDALASEVCSRVDLVSSIDFEISSDPTYVGNATALEPGDEATVTITSPTSTFTGFYDNFLPATLSSQVSIRIEQQPSWSDTASPITKSRPTC